MKAPQHLAQSAHFILQEYVNAHEQEGHTSVKSCAQWCKPDIGFYKLNVDGAIF